MYVKTGRDDVKVQVSSVCTEVKDEMIKDITEANRKYLLVHHPPTMHEKLWAEDLND